jgi:hypothetical protein
LTVNRPGLRTLRRSWWALVLLVLASCGSGTGSGTSPGGADASLKSADTTVLAAMTRYAAKVNLCKAASSPVVCLEAADRTLGNQIHTYANLLAVRHGFSAPQDDVTTARNSAQTLANSLEILGDAQPTQANYDQVRNTFDVNAAIAQLQRAVSKVHHSIGG